jgi:GT2 family glycosyltransferase
MCEVSIIIVNWNAKQYLLNCIRSIKETTSDISFEIIVVDNASTDGSVSALNVEFPEVKLIQNHKNLGFAKGNNIGIRKAAGRYICLVNSDVLFFKGCLRQLADFMDKHPDVGMCAPKVLNSDLTVQETAGYLPNIWTEFGQAVFLDRIKWLEGIFPRPEIDVRMLTDIKRVPFLYGCFWMVSKIALDKVGLLDERFFMYGEDVDWCKRFNDAGFEVIYYPKAEVIHFGCASSANAPVKFYVEMKRSRLLYFRKHYGKTGRLVSACILFIFCTFRYIGWTVLGIVCPKKFTDSLANRKNYFACLKWLLTGNMPH